MEDVGDALVGFDLRDSDPVPTPCQKTHSRAMCAMVFDLEWSCGCGRHTERLVARELDLWRDILPFELEPDLMDKPVNHTATRQFGAGELIVPHQTDLAFNLSQRSFHRGLIRSHPVEPRCGRFYPRAFIAGSRGIFPDEMLPFRVTSTSGDMIGCDLNNPLADRPLMLSARILDIWSADESVGGHCNDVAEMVTRNGPGMQARWLDEPTDFWQDTPFRRPDEGVDTRFYAAPRMVSHVDRTASANIGQLYRRLLPSGGRVLDLMASWESHLPDDHGLARIVGLGLNHEELAANPLLAAFDVHDLNEQPRLPYDDGEFDGAICSLSVEYLTQPFAVFAEIARVLRPGGRFIVTFSNRWFPPKVTRIWADMHEFERQGLVSEFFLRDGHYRELETLSVRGLPRPADDRYADRLADSDPVFAVWATRR